MTDDLRKAPPAWVWWVIAGFALLALFAIFACKPRERPADTPDSTQVAPSDSIAPEVDTSEGEGPIVSETSAESDSLAVEDLDAADTVITAADSAAQRRRSAVPVGLPVGLNKFPPDQWCDGHITGTVASFNAKIAAGVVRKAEFCRVKIIGAIPRSMLTNTGTAKGYFVLSKGKQACDLMGRAIGGMQDHPNLVAIWLIDEPQTTTWAGRPARASDIAEYTRYCKSKMPRVPTLMRVNPSNEWLSNVPNSAWSGVDLYYAVWKKGRGNRRLNGQWAAQQKGYYDQEVAAANRRDAGVVLSLNFTNCNWDREDVPCTPSEVRTFGRQAVQHPANCFYSAWWFDETWRRSDYRAAWADVVAAGRQRGAVSCERG